MEMTQETIYSIILMGLMIVGIVLTFVVGKTTTDPAKLHKRVYNLLNNYARPRKFRVLNNVPVETKDGVQTVDHVMVGYFGLLFVNDLLLHGDYYGELPDSQWICSKTDKQSDTTTRIGSVANPLLSARACMEASVDLLARHCVYNMPMDAIAVKAHKKGEFVITGSKNCVFTLRSLRGFLQYNFFLKDTGLDVDKVCAILEGKA